MSADTLTVAVETWCEATNEGDGSPRTVEFQYRPLAHWPWTCTVRSGRKATGREAVGRTPLEAFETARRRMKVPAITEAEDAELTAAVMERAETNRRMADVRR